MIERKKDYFKRIFGDIPLRVEIQLREQFAPGNETSNADPVPKLSFQEKAQRLYAKLAPPPRKVESIPAVPDVLGSGNLSDSKPDKDLAAVTSSEAAQTSPSPGRKARLFLVIERVADRWNTRSLIAGFSAIKRCAEPPNDNDRPAIRRLQSVVALKSTLGKLVRRTFDQLRQTVLPTELNSVSRTKQAVQTVRAVVQRRLQKDFYWLMNRLECTQRRNGKLCVLKVVGVVKRRLETQLAHFVNAMRNHARVEELVERAQKKRAIPEGRNTGARLILAAFSTGRGRAISTVLHVLKRYAEGRTEAEAKIGRMLRIANRHLREEEKLRAAFRSWRTVRDKRVLSMFKTLSQLLKHNKA